MRLSFFGGFQVIRAGDGAPVRFATNATRALLAYLAVEADRPHTREFLGGLLWPDHTRAAAQTNLRQTLTRLRRAIPDQPEQASPVEVATHALQFNADANGVTTDVADFQSLLAACASHGHSALERCPECLARLRKAAELYRGDFLQGLYFDHSSTLEEWALFKREELHRQAVQTMTTLARGHEWVADFERMRHYAARLVALEPWREEAQSLLIRALAFCGQSKAALEQYEACRRVLDQELGVEPSNETRGLYERIKVGTLTPPTLDAPLPAHNLPAHLTPFIGREGELAELAERLGQPETRLITVIGPGGMGKTRLALEAARSQLDRFPDGVFFVSLAPVTSASAIVPAIASAIGIQLHTSDPKQALLQSVSDKRLLFIFDNCEHLLSDGRSIGQAGEPDIANLIIQLLQAAPGLRFLATSRARLNISGEHAFTLQGMGYAQAQTTSPGEALTAPAVRLFAQSARRVRPHFNLNASDLPVVLRICQRVDGMPLGLELAAAWTELMSLDDIAAEMERHADFLAADWRDAPERHRSMRAVFDWSWRLLSDAEQRAFRTLSVFRGGFTREAADAVARASLRMLSGLVRKSLLRWREEKGSSGRYEIHELLRQFAAEQLGVAGDEAEVAHARHAMHYLDFVAACEHRITHDEPRQVAAEIQAELDNVRQAWNWAVDRGHHVALVPCAFAFWTFCGLTGKMLEGEAALSRAARRFGDMWRAANAAVTAVHGVANDETSQHLRSNLSKAAAIHAMSLVHGNHYDAAIHEAEEALALARADQRLACREAEVFSLMAQGQSLKWQGKLAESYPRLERVLATIAAIRMDGLDSDALTEMEWGALVWLGHVGADLRGDVEFATTHIQRALQLCRKSNKRMGEMVCLTNLADFARLTGDAAVAEANYEQALHLGRALGYRWGEGTTQMELADALRQQGRYEEACKLLVAACAVFTETGDLNYLAYGTISLGRMYAHMGDFVRARACLERAMDLLGGGRSAEIEAFGESSLALLHHLCGNDRDALDHAQRGWQIAQASCGARQQATLLVMLGHAHAGLACFDAAGGAYDQALDLFTRLGLTHLAVEPEAGLARIALARGDVARAMSHAEAVLAVLAAKQFVGVDEPFAAYLWCVQTLLAADDVRAMAVLHTAHMLLHDYVRRINDEGMRQAFLANVAAHRELEQLYVSSTATA